MRVTSNLFSLPVTKCHTRVDLHLATPSLSSSSTCSPPTPRPHIRRPMVCQFDAFPSHYKQFLKLLTSALFDILPSLRLECYVSRMDAMDSMIIVVVLPIILSVVLLTAGKIHDAFQAADGRIFNRYYFN